MRICAWVVERGARAWEASVGCARRTLQIVPAHALTSSKAETLLAIFSSNSLASAFSTSSSSLNSSNLSAKIKSSGPRSVANIPPRIQAPALRLDLRNGRDPAQPCHGHIAAIGNLLLQHRRAARIGLNRLAAVQPRNVGERKYVRSIGRAGRIAAFATAVPDGRRILSS